MNTVFASNAEKTLYRPLSLALALGLAAMPGAVAAAPPTASALAWDMDVNIKVAGLTVLDLNSQNTAGFTDQSTAQSVSDSAPSFDSGPGLARLTAGLIKTEAVWSPGSTYHVVGARSDIADLALGVVSVADESLLEIAADQLVAVAMVSGSCPPAAADQATLSALPWLPPTDWVFQDGFDQSGNLHGGSDVQVPGLSVSVTGTGVANIPTTPEPNTDLSIPGLVTLILNEQTQTGDGITERGVSSNALRLDVNLIAIEAHVVLSHAEASMKCN